MILQVVDPLYIALTYPKLAPVKVVVKVEKEVPNVKAYEL